MKSFILTLLLLSSLFCKAQSDTSIVIVPIYTPYEDLIDSIWMNVDTSHLQTNYLTDYGPWFTDPSWYNGTDLTNNNLLNYSKMESVYSSFAYSEMSDDLILEDWDSINLSVSSFMDNGEVPVVILTIPFDRLDSNALANGLVTSDGNYLHSVPGSPSPFIVQEFYGAALAVDLLDTNAFEVVLPSNLIFNQFEKSITHVEIDFSDGLGPQMLLPNQTLEVTYDPTDYGFKPIIYKIYFNDNTWVTTHGGVSLKYKYDSDIPGTSEIPAGDVFDITAEHPFAGKFGKAKVTIAYGCGHTKLMKPLIIVPGIDPPELDNIGANLAFWSGVSGNGFQSDIGTETYESFIEWMMTQFTVREEFMRKVGQEGYDLVYIDYEDGADWIQRNGEVTRTVIAEVNRLKALNGSTEPNMVLGISMGGLVSRYALATMEQNNEDHDVESWLNNESELQSFVSAEIQTLAGSTPYFGTYSKIRIGSINQ